MPHMLNLTLKLKQDEETKLRLIHLRQNFNTEVQPSIDKALRESELVHFARVIVIDDTYIQILTEYDGDKRGYTDFFREKLPKIFSAIFALAEGAPDVNDSNAFYAYSSKHNVQALGQGVDEEGYLFSAYADKHTVKEIKTALQGAPV